MKVCLLYHIYFFIFTSNQCFCLEYKYFIAPCLWYRSSNAVSWQKQFEKLWNAFIHIKVMPLSCRAFLSLLHLHHPGQMHDSSYIGTVQIKNHFYIHKRSGDVCYFFCNIFAAARLRIMTTFKNVIKIYVAPIILRFHTTTTFMLLLE